MEIDGRVIDLRARVVRWHTFEGGERPYRDDRVVAALSALPQPGGTPISAGEWKSRLDGPDQDSSSDSTASAWHQRIHALLGARNGTLIERERNRYVLRVPRVDLRVSEEEVPVAVPTGILLHVRQRITSPARAASLRVDASLPLYLLRDEILRRFGIAQAADTPWGRITVDFGVYLGARQLDLGRTLAQEGVAEGDTIELEGDVQWMTPGGARGSGRLLRDPDGAEEHRLALLTLLQERLAEPAWFED